MKKSLVGVDVANAMQQRLVQQCGFNRCLALAEEGDELFETNGQRLGSRAFIRCAWRDEGQAAKAARVDEAELFASTKSENSVGVGWNRRVSRRDEEPSGHPEMNEKLRRHLLSAEVHDDSLADAMDAVDAAARECLNDLIWWRFEGLWLVAGPYRPDGLPVNAFVNAIGDGFDFGELGHDLIASIRAVAC